MTTPAPSPEALDLRPYTTAAQIVERALRHPRPLSARERQEWVLAWQRRALRDASPTPELERLMNAELRMAR